MDLTVIIPFCDGHSTIKALLSSIPPEFSVILVDDLSSERVKEVDKRTTVYRLDTKGYFSGAVNFGIKQCNTDVLVLNQDVQFESRRAFDFVLKNRKKYALIGERISGTHPAWPMGYVHGTFMFMRRDAIDRVGLLNAKHYPLWGSTCEWQIRASRNGFAVMPKNIPGMIHKRKGNFGSAITRLLAQNPLNRELFIRTPPLVSVIVPAYNHGRYLPDLVKSVLEQTFQAFDLIIADDCSTDETQEIMQDLADPWKGIKYVRTKNNSGTSVACNLAIKLSHAKYIARIDADDMRDPESLELMLGVQIDNPHSFVYDDVKLVDPHGQVIKAWAMKDYSFDELLVKNFIHAGIMFPKEAWIEIGGYPTQMRHGRDDWAFNIGLGVRGWCGVHLQHSGYLYRRHDDNRTLRNTTPAHREAFRNQIMGVYPEAFEEVRPMACCGGSRSSVTRSQTYQGNGGGAMTMAGMAGTKGMVLVEYQGGNYGEETFFGAFTGSAYTFSASKRQRWVDPRDLRVETKGGKPIGILDIMKNGKSIFKLYRQPVAEVAVEAAAIAAERETPAIIEEVAETYEAYIPDKAAEEKPAGDYFITLKGVGKATSMKLLDNGYLSMKQLAEANFYTLIEVMGWSAEKAEDIQMQASEIA